MNRRNFIKVTGSAGIAGMLAGARYGLRSIPSRWTRKLNPKVKTACQRQTLELLAMAESFRGVS